MIVKCLIKKTPSFFTFIKMQENNPLIVKPGKKFRSLSPLQVINKQRVIYEFDGKWLESFGKPERTARWFVKGPPSSGKSSLCFQLSEYLTKFGVVGYNNYEEGDSWTVADKIEKYGLKEKGDRFRLIPGEPIEEFKKRMLRRKSPNFGIIDSVQHAGFNVKTYKDFADSLCNDRRGKSLVFINHWKNSDLSWFIKHDCYIKVEVIGFIAHVEGRYGGGVPFVIWEKKAKEYWGKKYNTVIAGRYWPGQKK